METVELCLELVAAVYQKAGGATGRDIQWDWPKVRPRSAEEFKLFTQVHTHTQIQLGGAKNSDFFLFLFNIPIYHTST